MTSISNVFLDIYIPTTEASAENIPVESESNSTVYFKRPSEDEYEITTYDGFRFILNQDGSLWEDGNRFLLWRIKSHASIDPIAKSTIKKTAEDLEDYKRYCEHNELDYRVAKKITRRPNWKYREYLQNRLDNGEISPKFAVHRIRIVTSFYKWLIDIEGVAFDVPMFKVTKGIITYGNRQGVSRGKIVDVTDINQIPNASNENDGYIRDGGTLMPLLHEQQDALFDALEHLGNTEMTLAFLFSVTTGARKQTVFTLRLKHFVKSLPENYTQQGIDAWFAGLESIDLAKEYPLRVGPGTGIDTKFNKPYNLQVKGWMIRWVQTYIVSARAQRRRDGMLSQNSDLDQYVFITQKKAPFYVARNDINKSIYKTVQNGNAVDSFVSGTLKPYLKKKGHAFSFKFHDMRATFGMNFLEHFWPLVKEESISKEWVVDQLRKRMGHEDTTTTYGYLHHRELTKELNAAHDEREEKLMKVAENALRSA